MHLGRYLLALVCVAHVGLHAQLIVDASAWTEAAVPPPPMFDKSRLIDLPGQGPTSLAIGIDPATLSIGSDFVVRVVVVARNPNGSASTAMYEGIRCATAEHRLYARHYGDTGWMAVANSPWKPLTEGGVANHALKLARAGLCSSTVPNGNVEQMVKTLKTSPSVASGS